MINDIRLVCFDLNKTLIKENTWYDLNLAMGVTTEEDKLMLESYEAGKITYEEWQKLLSDIYIKNGKANRSTILRVINKYDYLDGAQDVLKYLKKQGYKLALLSGSIDMLVEKISKELGIDMYLAHNHLEFDKNNYFQKIVCVGDDSDFKVSSLYKFCDELGIDIKESAVVGDGDNDLKIFDASKHGITFKGSKIEQSAWKVIDKLTDIKTFL